MELGMVEHPDYNFFLFWSILQIVYAATDT